MTETYQPKKWEVSGFELCGWKLKDGTIRLGPAEFSTTGTIVDGWPETVELCGVVYTLEKEEWQPNGFGWGFYV